MPDIALIDPKILAFANTVANCLLAVAALGGLFSFYQWRKQHREESENRIARDLLSSLIINRNLVRSHLKSLPMAIVTLVAIQHFEIEVEDPGTIYISSYKGVLDRSTDVSLALAAAEVSWGDELKDLIDKHGKVMAEYVMEAAAGMTEISVARANPSEAAKKFTPDTDLFWAATEKSDKVIEDLEAIVAKFDSHLRPKLWEGSR